MEISSFNIFKSKAASKTRIYFQHINVFMMLLTIIMTMVMMALISAMMIITKYSLPTVDFATRYSTRYSDFLLQTLLKPYSKSKKATRRCLIKTQRTQGIASLHVLGLNAQNIYIKTYWPYRIYMHLYVPIWPDIFLQISSAMRALRAV